jgi:hypothetical protein
MYGVLLTVTFVYMKTVTTEVVCVKYVGFNLKSSRISAMLVCVDVQTVFQLKICRCVCDMSA